MSVPDDNPLATMQLVGGRPDLASVIASQSSAGPGLDPSATVLDRAQRGSQVVFDQSEVLASATTANGWVHQVGGEEASHARHHEGKGHLVFVRPAPEVATAPTLGEASTSCSLDEAGTGVPLGPQAGVESTQSTSPQELVHSGASSGSGPLRVKPGCTYTTCSFPFNVAFNKT